MKKAFSILLILSIILSVSYSMAENLYYWNIKNANGVLYKEETIMKREKYTCSNVSTSSDCKYYYTSLDKLSVISDINKSFTGTVFYGLKFSFFNKGNEWIDTIIDGNEMEQFGLFLEEANENVCSYNSCDGTIFTVFIYQDGILKGKLGVKVNKGNLNAYMPVSDLTTNTIEKLNTAKTLK